MNNSSETNTEQKQQKKFGESMVGHHFYEAKCSVSDLKWQIVEELYGDDVEQIQIRLLSFHTCLKPHIISYIL